MRIASPLGVDHVQLQATESKGRTLCIAEDLYLHDIELTVRRFVPDCFCPADVGHRRMHVAVEVESAKLFRLVQAEFPLLAPKRESDEHREIEDRPNGDASENKIPQPNFSRVNRYREQKRCDDKSSDCHCH